MVATGQARAGDRYRPLVSGVRGRGMCSDNICVRIRFLGPVRDLVGCESMDLRLQGRASVFSAVLVLLEKFPQLGERLSHYQFAVNFEYATGDTPLKDGDELALIPPVSGGSDGRETTGIFVKVTTEPIDLTSLFPLVSSPQAGAIVTFLGTVREFSHGKRVKTLRYEAYEPMATRELMCIAEEMVKQWRLCKIAIVHRTGVLSVGEISVAILVSSPHRSDAFEATRYAIERIKEVVPIWKQEHFVDGKIRWVEPEQGEWGESGITSHTHTRSEN